MRATAVPTVAIAGGGPAGAVAARVLARRGVRAVVLESAVGPTEKVGETLPPSAAPLLRHLGCEPGAGSGADPGPHLPSHGIRAHWGSERPAENLFLASPFGPGWHVDRRAFEAGLAAAAVAAGAEWRWGSRVIACRRDPAGGGGRWRLELATAGEAGAAGRAVLEADFVADATGRRASLARRLGARRRRTDRLVGIASILRPPAPVADSATLIEAVEDGWWYSAPLSGGRLAVAFFGDGDLLDRSLLQADPGAWRRRLARTSATRERAGGPGGGASAALRVFPAESSRLDRIAGAGWIALGDAAAAYDPLSSHGIAAAMGSGLYGGHAVTDLLAGRSEARLAYLDLMERNYGAYLELLERHYARERRWPDSPFWRRRRDPTPRDGSRPAPAHVSF